MSDQTPFDQGQYSPGGDMLASPEIQRQLAAMLPHDRTVVIQRFRDLQTFWAEDQAREGVNRGQTRADVAAKLTRKHPRRPVNVKALERWETSFLRVGLVGLLNSRRYGRGGTEAAAHPAHAKTQADYLVRIAEAIERLAGDLRQAARDMDNAGDGGSDEDADATD